MGTEAAEQSSTDSLPTTIREYQPDDLAFVLSSWCKSAAEKVTFSWIPRGTFMRLYHDWIEHAIQAGTIRVWIACDADAPSQIFGWLATSGRRTAHYAYVKQIYRGIGVLHKLADRAFGPPPHADKIIVTHVFDNSWATGDFLYVPEMFFTSEAIDWIRERHSEYKQNRVHPDA